MPRPTASALCVRTTACRAQYDRAFSAVSSALAKEGDRRLGGDLLLLVFAHDLEVRQRLLVAGSEPGDDFEAAVGMFGQSRAALDPVPAIHVADAELVVDDGVVDVAAINAVDIAALRFGGQRLLKGADIIHRVLDLVFGPLRQRPIGETKLAADEVEITVDQNGEIVGGIAE